MRDNQEMASILLSSNLATTEQLTESWVEITESRDIGQILVEKGLLLQNVYSDLLVYIDSLHPNGLPVVENTGDDYLDTDSIIIPADTLTETDDLPGGPYDADMSFDDSLHDISDDEIFGEETLHNPQPAQAYTEQPRDESLIITDAYEPEPARSSETFDFAPEAFVVDLGDVDPHVEDDNSMSDEYGSTSLGDSFFTSPAGSPSKVETVHERLKEVAGTKASTPTAQPIVVTENIEVEIKGPRIPDSIPGSRDVGELYIVIPDAISPRNTLNEILLFARNNSISDVHLIPEAPITMRRYGKLVPVSDELFTTDAIEKTLLEALPSIEMETFMKNGDVEFVYSIPGGGRYRVTIMRLRSGWSFAARIIAFEIPTFDAIGLPKSANTLTQWAQGLVLVTGPTGCGKSTTLATLVNMINQDRNEHIITIENPIETVFPVGQSQICQRQVGLHTLTQENALRGALRQDPDILMVSELRDMDSIQLAVSAAETGHLVFGTMNTINASRTIYRLIESFPADEQDVLRNMISESLRGVVSQQLVPRKDGAGVVPVFEVLLITPAVANMIRKNEMHQLQSAMITGRNQGMVIFDDSLMELVKADVISAEEAFKRANDPEPFKPLLNKGGA